MEDVGLQRQPAWRTWGRSGNQHEGLGAGAAASMEDVGLDRQPGWRTRGWIDSQDGGRGAGSTARMEDVGLQRQPAWRTWGRSGSQHGGRGAAAAARMEDVGLDRQPAWRTWGWRGSQDARRLSVCHVPHEQAACAVRAAQGGPDQVLPAGMGKRAHQKSSSNTICLLPNHQLRPLASTFPLSRRCRRRALRAWRAPTAACTSSLVSLRSRLAPSRESTGRR
eukprot:335039-Chlamydomonas_euryale.AAC.2